MSTISEFTLYEVEDMIFDSSTAAFALNTFFADVLRETYLGHISWSMRHESLAAIYDCKIPENGIALRLIVDVANNATLFASSADSEKYETIGVDSDELGYFVKSIISAINHGSEVLTDGGKRLAALLGKSANNKFRVDKATSVKNLFETLRGTDLIFRACNDAVGIYGLMTGLTISNELFHTKIVRAMQIAKTILTAEEIGTPNGFVTLDSIDQALEEGLVYNDTDNEKMISPDAVANLVTDIHDVFYPFFGMANKTFFWSDRQAENRRNAIVDAVAYIIADLMRREDVCDVEF